MARKRFSQWWNENQPFTPSYQDSQPEDWYEGMLETFRAEPPMVPFGNPIELAKHYTSAIYLAIRTLARQVSQAVISLREKDHPFEEDHTPVPANDPLVDFYADPNPTEDIQDILEQQAIQLSLTGIGLKWTPFDGNYDVPPNEQYILPTCSVIPLPLSPRYPRGAWQVQPWFPEGPFTFIPSNQAVGAILPAEEVHLTKDPHPMFRWTGYAALTAIGRQVDLLDAVDDSRWNKVLNGMQADVAITFDKETKATIKKADVLRITKQLQMVAKGPQNAGNIPVIPPGASLDKIGNAPYEMTYVESWVQLLEFILACYGVQKSVAGLTEGASYAQVYASLLQFHLLTLNPTLHKLARSDNKKIVHPYFDARHYLHLEAPAINDKTLLESQLANDVKVGSRSLNEFRKTRNLPAVPWGNERAIQLQAQPVPEPIDEDNTDEALADGRNPGDPMQKQVNRTRPRKDKPGLAKKPTRKSILGSIDSSLSDRLSDYRPLPNGRRTFLMNGHSKQMPRSK